MTLAEHGLGFDLELDARAHLTAIGAVLEDRDFRRDRPRPLAPALRDLDTFAAPAPFVFGHNILWHDLPWLAAHAPDLTLLDKPAVDTLAPPPSPSPSIRTTRCSRTTSSSATRPTTRSPTRASPRAC